MTSTSWPGASPALAHRPVLMGERGIVVAGHHRAAEAGIEILQEGGNAIDAAIATAAALAVAVPFMNGLGGDCIALYAPANGSVKAINGSGALAERASVEEIRQRGHVVMPIRGPLSVSVPGLVAALGEARDRFGSMPLARLLAPAIALGRNGVPIDAAAVGFYNGPGYAALAAEYPDLSRHYGPAGGRVLGERLKQPGVAAMLEAVARGGAREFYEGALARSWLRAAQASGVLLEQEDLAGHRTDFSPALTIAWRGRQAHVAPPNSQGLALLALLRLSERRPRPAAAEAADPLIDPLSFLEDKTRAFIARDRWCVDPRRLPLDAAALEPRTLEGLAAEDATASSTRSGGGDTSTLVVIDRNGNAVSWAQSLFEEFGSGIVAGEHGLVLHNRAGLERLDGEEVYRLRGGLRPFHTLCPALTTRSDGETIAIATPGDHGQPQSLNQVLRRLCEQGLDPQASVEWPRLRHDRGDVVMLEDRCPADWDRQLAGAGWSPRRVGPWSRLMGGVNVIVRRPDGLMLGGADPRRSSYALSL